MKSEKDQHAYQTKITDKKTIKATNKILIKND